MTCCLEFVVDGQQEALASATENVGPDSPEEPLSMLILEDLSTAVHTTSTLSLHTAALCIPTPCRRGRTQVDFSSHHHDQLAHQCGVYS